MYTIIFQRKFMQLTEKLSFREIYPMDLFSLCNVMIAYLCATFNCLCTESRSILYNAGYKFNRINTQAIYLNYIYQRVTKSVYSVQR